MNLLRPTNSLLLVPKKQKKFKVNDSLNPVLLLTTNSLSLLTANSQLVLCVRKKNHHRTIKAEEEVDDVLVKSSHDSINNIRDLDIDCVTNSFDITNINADNNVRPDSLYLLYDVNAIQQDDFASDNNQYYLNNNNDCDPVRND